MKFHKISYLDVERCYLIYANEDMSLEHAIEVTLEMVNSLLRTPDFHRQMADYWYHFKNFSMNVWQWGDGEANVHVALYSVDGCDSLYDDSVWSCVLPVETSGKDG